MTTNWQCAGCGIASPDRLRSCDCPTNVVCATGQKGTAWKRDTDEDDAIKKAIGLLLAHGYAITPPVH